MDEHIEGQPGPENQGDITRAQENRAPTKGLQAFQDVPIKKFILESIFTLLFM